MYTHAFTEILSHCLLNNWKRCIKTSKYVHLSISSICICQFLLYLFWNSGLGTEHIVWYQNFSSSFLSTWYFFLTLNFNLCVSLYLSIWYLGFLGGTSGKNPSCQCGRHSRHRFDSWVRKIPWKRAWQPTPASLPGESHWHRSLVGYGQ